jgi:hypothetical protein
LELDVDPFQTKKKVGTFALADPLAEFIRMSRDKKGLNFRAFNY